MAQKRIIDVGGFSLSLLQKGLVNQVLDSERLSYGPMTQEFERRWSELHKVKYSLFCNSGTSALQVALHALKEENKWEDGDEVLLPAVTFVATLNIILHNNMKPVFVDVEPFYYNINPEAIEKRITPKTKAIVVVHLLGQPALMDPIMAIAKKHNLKVIEDSCETVGATYKRIPVGGFGDVSCFSTYASHLVVTGVGGFACTNDPDLAIRIKGLYNHGRDGIYHSIDDNAKGVQIMKSRFNFTHDGYSYRATELEAALGIGHLERFEEEFKKRNENAKYLISRLLDLEAKEFFTLPRPHTDVTHSYMLFGIVLNPFVVNREELLLYLEEHGIMTRYMMPLLTQPYVKKMFGNLEDTYPVAKLLDQSGFLIGCHPQLGKPELDYISDTIHAYCEQI